MLLVQFEDAKHGGLSHDKYLKQLLILTNSRLLNEDRRDEENVRPAVEQ